jgi:hypothetical protein
VLARRRHTASSRALVASEAAYGLALHEVRLLHQESVESRWTMKYGIAWLLGVPGVVILGWLVLTHC